MKTPPTPLWGYTSQIVLSTDNQINNAIKNRAFNGQRDKYSLPSFNRIGPERIKITQFSVSLLSQNLSKKMQSVSAIRSAYFGQRTSEQNFSSVCVILYTYSNLFLCTSFVFDELWNFFLDMILLTSADRRYTFWWFHSTMTLYEPTTSSRLLKLFKSVSN